MHGARMPAIHISIVGTKRRHLELETVFDHEDHPKMRANRVGARKKLLHHFRRRIGDDIEVFRSFAANDVAHAAPGEVRKMAVLAHPGGNFARRLFHGGFHCGRGRFFEPPIYLASAGD